MSRVITGANLFRSRLSLQAADIFGIDTAPIVVVPGIPGKIIAPISVIGTIAGQTVAFLPQTNAAASICYGTTYDANKLAFPPEILFSLIDGELGANGVENFFPAGLGFAFGDFAGLPISLVSQGAGKFAAGSATGATVASGHGGTGYSVGDTGGISISHASPSAQYTVAAETGGVVTAVTISAAGGGIVPGTYATTVSTGGGDGNLELTISSGQIQLVGNGTVEIDVIYQPI